MSCNHGPVETFYACAKCGRTRKFLVGSKVREMFCFGCRNLIPHKEVLV